MALCDRFGRAITYLRISVTDRCNLRCVYCLPEQGLKWQPRENELSVDEIGRITAEMARAGVTRIRLTGGEPLLRREIVEIVAALAAIPGIQEVSLTTNAMCLERMAGPLAEAGLRRVNISLDTLEPDKFRRITRGGSIERVWRGIAAAERAGLRPIKLNTVLVRGLNDDELPALAALTIEHPWHVRFIELMPIGNGQAWGHGLPPPSQRFISAAEMRERLAPFGLEPCPAPNGNGPARTFRTPGALGTLGFISPLSEHFCGSCNRMRLTADGFLRPCLLQDGELDLRGALRAGEPLLPLIRRAIEAKPEGHGLAARQFPESRRMAQIGG